VKLHVMHRTRYEYPAAVIESFNETRLQPTSADGQVCHAFLLKVLPSTRLSHYLDFYLNCVHFFEIPEPHSTLTIESSSVVTTVSRAMPPDQTTVPMSRLRECVAMEQCYDFMQSSKHVHIDPALWRLAIDATLGEEDAWQSALKVMHFIHSSYADCGNRRQAEGGVPGLRARDAGDVPQPEDSGAVRERLPVQRPAG
jgi:transglutaminase-like putative cysteine protease